MSEIRFFRQAAFSLQAGFPADVVDLRGAKFGGAACWFGMVVAGEGALHCEWGRFPLREGMYFVLPGPGHVEGSVHGLGLGARFHRGLFQVGGPIEETGRLRYVDGCTDTLLVGPPRRGDPCLNHLHVPAETCQRAHTHPSYRVGVIVAGEGTCVEPARATPLTPGLAFCIPADVRHAFHTSTHALDVFAFHPDTDFGPTDEDHPMINRTIE